MKKIRESRDAWRGINIDAHTEARKLMHLTRPFEWGFLKEFYQRDKQSQQQIAKLSSDVTMFTAALQNAGVIAQGDRIALNTSHEHLRELQSRYDTLKLASKRSENNLHAERQEHQLCQETLIHERMRHEETEKTLRCVWDAKSRLMEILSNARELEVQATNIFDLELSIMRSQQVPQTVSSVNGMRHTKQAGGAQSAEIEN